MCYPIYGMVLIKESLLLIGKSSLCCGCCEFYLSLSEWFFTIIYARRFVFFYNFVVIIECFYQNVPPFLANKNKQLFNCAPWHVYCNEERKPGKWFI